MHPRDFVNVGTKREWSDGFFGFRIESTLNVEALRAYLLEHAAMLQDYWLGAVKADRGNPAADYMVSSFFELTDNREDMEFGVFAMSPVIVSALRLKFDQPGEGRLRPLFKAFSVATTEVFEETWDERNQDFRIESDEVAKLIIERARLSIVQHYPAWQDTWEIAYVFGLSETGEDWGVLVEA